jgi:hypothetical protein
MSFLDGVLLTIFNTIVCLVLPKVLSVIFATKNQDQVIVPSQPAIASSDSSSEIPTFSEVIPAPSRVSV